MFEEYQAEWRLDNQMSYKIAHSVTSEIIFNSNNPRDARPGAEDEILQDAQHEDLLPISNSDMLSPISHMPSFPSSISIGPKLLNNVQKQNDQMAESDVLQGQENIFHTSSFEDIEGLVEQYNNGIVGGAIAKVNTSKLNHLNKSLKIPISHRERVIATNVGDNLYESTKPILDHLK